MSDADEGMSRHMWPEECTRVVFLVTRTPTMDGVNTALRSLAGELTRRGVEVEFISLWPGTGVPLGPTRVVESNEAWHRGPSLRGRGGGWRNFWRLPLVAMKRIDRRVVNRSFRLAIEVFGPETVLVFTNVWLKTRLDEAGFCRSPGGPLCIGQHHSSFASVAGFSPGAAETAAHFSDLDAFVALTTEDAAGFATLLPTVHCTAIGNPLPPGSFPESAREPIAISIGRYSPEKQLDMMIEVFMEATSVPELGRWRLHLYGEGPDENRIRDKIDASAAAGRVKLCGRVEDVGQITRSASVHLLTSKFEGWGMCIVEAALSAVPTIAFDCAPGVRELVGPGCGVLVPPGDRVAFVAALREAMYDAEGLRLQGEAARHHVAEFAPALITDQWARLIRRCLDARRAAG